VPLVVLPSIVLVIVLFAQVLMLTMNTAALLGNRQALAMFWSHVKFFQSSLAFIYGLIAIALWHAPVYAWLLMISAWAKRTPLLWAVLPPLMLAAFERMAFGTKHFAELLGYRFVGWFQRAFVMHLPNSRDELEPLAHLTPGKYLATPGLWVGLLFAVIFLAIAIRLRHTREPI
jgi:ABC-2 type transport system permease protein